MVELLKVAGPQLKRPKSDTLKGSGHANMKELRFDADNGVWRVPAIASSENVKPSG